MELRVGDRIRLIGEHRSDGSVFTREARAGDLGTIEAFRRGGKTVIVNWDPRPGGWGVTTSWVDSDCLEPEYPPVNDVELTAALKSLTEGP